MLFPDLFLSNEDKTASASDYFILSEVGGFDPKHIRGFQDLESSGDMLFSTIHSIDCSDCCVALEVETWRYI